MRIDEPKSLFKYVSLAVTPFTFSANKVPALQAFTHQTNPGSENINIKISMSK